MSASSGRAKNSRRKRAPREGRALPNPFFYELQSCLDIVTLEVAISDGPHRSLPMRAGWKRVAECGDNHAYAPEEIRNAIIPALEQDCRAEITPQFVDALYKMFREQEISLFKDQLGPQLEVLRRIAGPGLDA